MEGVGARLGRSSTRYGPATVFTGPVRKWKKRWVHVTPPNSGNVKHNHHQASANGGVNGNNGSHLLLLKWTPVTARQNNKNNSNGGADKNDDSISSAKDDAVAEEEAEEPRKRKFKYIPVFSVNSFSELYSQSVASLVFLFVVNQIEVLRKNCVRYGGFNFIGEVLLNRIDV